MYKYKYCHPKYCPAVCLCDQKYPIKERTGWLWYGSQHSSDTGQALAASRGKSRISH